MLESRDLLDATNLTTAVVSASEVNLTWDLTDASDTAVIIERATASSGPYKVLATLPGGENIFTDTNGWAGTTYFYRVRTDTATGPTPYSATASATTRAPAAGAMAAVTDLTARPTSATEALVTFTDPNPSLASRYYLLERSADGVAYQTVKSLGTSTSWQDTGLVPGATYYYRVLGCSWSAPTSDYSTPTTVTLPDRTAGRPTEPSGLTATANSATSVTVTWVNNDTATTRFKVERAIYSTWSAPTWAQVTLTSAGATSFTDTGLTAESAYLYRVRATNAAGDSAYATPVSDVMDSLFGTAAAVVTASAGTGTPKVYDIGPGKPYQNIADLDWTKLGPGDTVNIHYKPGGYHEIFMVSTRGTSNSWITINGIPDPATGALPVIDGVNAVMAPQFASHYAPLSGYGLVVVGARPGFKDGYQPGYVSIQNLQIQNAYKDYSFTDYDGTRKNYGAVGAGVYLERADNVTLLGNTINANGEGVFGAGQSTFNRLMANITLDHNYIYGNGNPGSYLEHNTYLEGIDTVYQNNRYGPTRSGSAGAGLKDRSAGLIIRNNYIEGGTVQVQLPEAQNQIDLAITLGRYHKTYVYGNVLFSGPGNASTFVWFGGDQGLTAFNRKGIVYLYGNTLISQSDKSSTYATTAVRLQSAGETLDARNNIIVAIPNTPGATPSDLGLLGPGDNAYFGSNWVASSFSWTTTGSRVFTGHIGGTSNLIVGPGTEPEFVSISGPDFHLNSGSAAIDKAGRLAGAAALYPLTRQYAAPIGSQPRQVVGSASDLGAFEYGNPNSLPANTAPTVSDVGNQALSQGGSTGALPFTVGDAETAPGALTVTATSSNTTLVPASAIALGGTGATRTVTVTPAPGLAGTATITLTVTDAAGLTATDTFVLTVNPPANTAPTVSDVGDQAISRGGSTGALPFTVGDAETAPGALTVTATSSNPKLVPASAIALGGTGATRTVTVTPTAKRTGTATITLTVTDAAGLTATDTFVLTVNPPANGTSPPPAQPALVTQEFAAGSESGGSVQLYGPDGSLRFTATPFGAGFAGGVRTVTADFNKDGVADVAAGTGPGGSTRVVVLDGATQAVLLDLAPFEAAFTGGVCLAAGDLDGDGAADLVITPDEGGGSRVLVYAGPGFGVVADFFGIDDTSFRGGARAALGDVNADGYADLIVSAGFGGGPRISGYDGRDLAAGKRTKLFADFFLFEPALRNGAYVSIGDVDGDGYGDLIGGGGPGGGPRVYALSGRNLLAGNEDVVANFFVGDTGNRGGVRVAVKDLDGDALADLVVGDGTGAGSRVTAYHGKDLINGEILEAFRFDAFPGLNDGVFVG
ncbi:VCBS repeat-containing protein [bacterium]|nr:VCBS repeat-containing protein [bacterium]